MGWLTRSATAAAIAAGGFAVSRFRAGSAGTRRRPGGRVRELAGRAAARRRGPGREPAHFVVTVDRTPAELAPGGRLPEPIARLGDGVRVTVRPAPGGRGTELAAWLRDDEPAALAELAARFSGEDRRAAVRSALRQAKQVAETGEVLRPDRPLPAGPR